MPGRTELRRPTTREAFDCRFGRAIRREAWQTGAGADGADVDDAARGAQMGQHGLGHEEGAADVEVVDETEVGGSEVGEILD